MSGTVSRACVTYRVPYADADQMRVVYYANYLVYFERARSQLLRDMGLPYGEIERRGVGLPVIEAHVDYRAPARYEDELCVYGWVDWVRRVRLRIGCAVFRGDTLLAEGYTVHACIDLTSGRPLRVPAEIRGSLHATG